MVVVLLSFPGESCQEPGQDEPEYHQNICHSLAKTLEVCMNGSGQDATGIPAMLYVWCT